MKRKGFTLIELLAVIVILAIIALIATPAVLNIIEDSRKSAAEASARNIVSAAKTYYMSEIMNGRNVGTIDLSTNTLKYDGDQAEKGYVSFTDGKPESEMYIGGYCVAISIDGKVESEKMEADECEAEPIIPSVVYTKYKDGTPLLYDPVNNVKCIDTEVETNVNNYKSTHNDSYYNAPIITGLKDGCMKWYAFLDSEDSSTVNLILDHNTTDNVAWNSDRTGTTPDTANGKLKEDVTNWNADVKATARLISAEEISHIAKINPFSYDSDGYGTMVEISNWEQNNSKSWYYLHTGNRTEYIGETGSNTYAWLFDNIATCTTNGCNVEDNGTEGYWTSSFASSDLAWVVRYDGYLGCNVVVDGIFHHGVRPVITVSKDVFKEN